MELYSLPKKWEEDKYQIPDSSRMPNSFYVLNNQINPVLTLNLNKYLPFQPQPQYSTKHSCLEKYVN